jgi:maltose alpha-D-glucosyltransferase/alpha-amylase
VTAREIAGALTGPGAGALGAFLARQRWVAASDRVIETARLLDSAPLREDPAIVLVVAGAAEARYFVPLAARTDVGGLSLDPAREVTRVRGHVIYDANWDPEFPREVVRALAAEREIPASQGRFACGLVGPWPDLAEATAMPCRPLSAEQTNTSVVIGRRFILKSLRRLEAGPSCEFEVGRFLATRTGFADHPGLTGWMEYRDAAGGVSTVAMLQPYVENLGDGWSVTLGTLRALADDLVHELPPERLELGAARLAAMAGDLLDGLQTLGSVTGGLHVALASDASSADFCPEPVTELDVEAWRAAIREDARRTLALAEERAPSLPSAAPALRRLLAGGGLQPALDALSTLPRGGAHKTRCHGDYHLGQVLRTSDGFVVVDFEGEPARPLKERRGKHSPLRDVAGMLRSFDYAGETVLAERSAPVRQALREWMDTWRRLAIDAFWRGYETRVRPSPVPLLAATPGETRRACAAFEIEKALYELRYELGYRPAWAAIPLAGIGRLLGAGGAGAGSVG